MICLKVQLLIRDFSWENYTSYFLGEVINGWFDLLGTKTGRKHGEIKMSIQFISKDSQEERTHIMEDAYFPAREGCQMTLYQDANTPQLPVFDGLCHPDGSSYVATNAWKDLYDSITNAQKFIYITGWSVNTNIQLLRGEDDPEGKSNVGELLKAKAEDGVCVLLLLWDEPASSSLGLMGTHSRCPLTSRLLLVRVTLAINV